MTQMAARLIPPSEMRTLGIIGGTSWHSTVEYYRHINSSINALYGGPVNPPLVLYNLNQEGIHSLQSEGAWAKVADIYYAAAMRLQAAGSQGLLLAANTPHKIFDNLAGRIALPILHIADAIGRACA
jgi:aspartate racemase